MARKSIASLNIRLSAVTTSFTQGMDKAGDRLTKFGRKLAMSKSRFAAFGPALSLAGKGIRGFHTAVGFGIKTLGTFLSAMRRVVTVGIASFTAAIAGLSIGVRKAMTDLDSLAKTAAKLGIDPGALNGLRFAAEQSGIAVNTFDMALQRMTRRLSEAANDTGEAQGALKELRLDARELAKLSPDQQILRIADAFGKVNSQADKVRLAFKLFDSEGVALVNLLNQGRAGIQAMIDDSNRLGGAFSAAQLKLVEDANDAINRVRTIFLNGFRHLAIQVSPFITAIAKRFEEWATSGEGVAEKVISIFEKMGITLAKIFDTIASQWEITMLKLKRFALETLQEINSLSIAIASIPIAGNQKVAQQGRRATGVIQGKIDANQKAMENAFANRDSIANRTQGLFNNIRKDAAGAALNENVMDPRRAKRGIVIPEIGEVPEKIAEAAAEKQAEAAERFANAVDTADGEQQGPTEADRQQERERRDPGQFKQGKIALAGIRGGGISAPANPMVSAQNRTNFLLNRMVTLMQSQGIQVAV